MYIRTPKRYRGMQRRRVFSCQRFLLLGLLMVIIAIGVGIYEIRDMLRPGVMQVVDAGMAQVDSWQSTQFAPTAAPTRDPSSILIDADNEWRASRIGFALNTYEDVVELVPNDVAVHIRLTEGFLTRGNVEMALVYADSTVTANPFSADAWATLAFAQSWDGQYAVGIASAQQALALEPNNARATAYLAYAYFNAGSQQAILATNRAEDAIALDPNHWAGYWVRGLVRENVFPVDYAGALSDYEMAYNLAREQNPAMAGVAGASYARVVAIDNPQRAIDLLNEMLTLDDSNREVLFYLGTTYYSKLGQYAEAQGPFADCVDIAPTDYSCWYMLGRTLNTLGDQEGALDAFEQAVELDTPYARHYWWAGNMERNLGSCAAATSYLEIGYDMVIEGGLAAADEGDAILIGHFEDELATCRIAIVPNSAATPIGTEEAVAEGEDS